MSLQEARCDRCQYYGRFPDVLRSYKLSDDQKLNIHQTFAWCQTCDKVVWAEQIESIEQLEATLAEILDYSQTRPKNDVLTDKWMVEGWLEDARLRVTWRRARTSPPKCLECGSTLLEFAVEHKDQDEEVDYLELVHPGCGGTIFIRFVGFSTTSAWPFYTPEGDRLAERYT